jgi:hypothetical protein
MSIRTWVLATRVIAAVGLGVFAAITLLAGQNSDLSAFANTWIYDAHGSPA